LPVNAGRCEFALADAGEDARRSDTNVISNLLTRARAGSARPAALLLPGALIAALLLASMGCASASGSTGATAQYTVGGTVSGLSGALVLADNGGDRLNLRGSGTFTFNRPLVDGAAYNVTVVTSPARQTCTVLGGLGTVVAADVTGVTVACATNAPPLAADAFRRPDGPLGRAWRPIAGAALAISDHEAAGTVAGLSGDVRVRPFPVNQYSQITVTSATLSGTEWIGAAVRVSGAGQSAYVGAYTWNNGAPELIVFLRDKGIWTQLGSPYSTGPLAAGTQLRLLAVGSTIAFLENGIERVAVGDATLTAGQPGIMANGTGKVGDWCASPAGFQADYLQTDASGIRYYNVISANDSGGPQELRVLQPTHPAAGLAHNFLFVLPVEAGTGSNYGDGMATLAALDAQDKYNLTIIEPSFSIVPWYANNPLDPGMSYEAFMTRELVPWAEQTLGTTGHEQNWLIGFSKSGMGAQDLLFKHPHVFTLAASWDFPADMYNYAQYGGAANYGTDANFLNNYRLTPAFLAAHKRPFLNNDRIWIGGWHAFRQDDTDYNVLLTAEGIRHNTQAPETNIPHRWDSGWVPLALAALHQDSIHLPSAG
jgi:hypothetical protein